MPTVFNQKAIVGEDALCVYGTKISHPQIPAKDFILSQLNPVYTVTNHFSRIVTSSGNIFCIFGLFHAA
jgi:hypothetical protein